jgi:hypothetical protein
MRDQLLLEEYGGLLAEAVEVRHRESDTELPEESPGDRSTDNYDVPAIVLARRHLGVVDNWADRVGQVAELRVGQFEHQVLRRDGQLLIEVFKRLETRDRVKNPGCAIGAKLAAEELEIRLKHFPEV